MEGIKQRLLGLCLAPVLLCVLDNTLTLVGQSSQYWAGNYGCVNEGSPTFCQLLQIHPAAFIAGGAIWIMVFVGGILLLPGTLALILSIAVTFGHTAGAASWLYFRFHYGYQICNGLFLLSAMLVGIGIRWGWRALPERDYRLRRLPSLARWVMLVVLLGASVYLYLWPRSQSDVNVAGNDEDAAKVTEATATTDRELEQLGRQPQLTRLCLIGPEITGDGLAHLKGLARLEGLTLQDIVLTDAGLKHLEGLHELKCLTFVGVSIADSGLRHLAKLTQLEDIILCGPLVTDAWLEQTSELTQLQFMSLAGTKVTDAGLKHLEGLKQLRSLLLSSSLVSDNGLKHLQGLPQLHDLSFRNMKITDAGLENLKGLTQLKTLCLDCTNCTPEGKKKLRQSLPKCRIDR